MRGGRLISMGVIFMVALFLAGVYVVGKRHQIMAPSKVVPVKTISSQTLPHQSTPLAHIFVIVEENKLISDIIGNSEAPYINKLAQEYSVAANYYGVSHPSLPNYLALTSGSTNNVTTDCTPPSGCELNVPNIADAIEKSGRTWKEYAESMPAACYTYNSGEYATKHSPFLYYTDILGNSARCKAHVVPFSQLTADLESVQTTPNLAFITPNLCDDMHDCPVADGNSWLGQNVPKVLNSKAFTTQNSLLIITWDEGDNGTNHVPTILIGTNVKHGYQSSTYYDHYALLHTIESEWGLPTLTTSDKQAPVMSEFFTTK